MKQFLYLFSIIAISIALSCKEDSKFSDDSNSIEDIYFDDYEAPKEKWGYLDTTGKTVIKPIYDDVRDMESNITAANFQGRWGYINVKGKEVIPFIYKQVRDYNPDMDRSIVQDFSNNWLLIDELGQIIDSLEYTDYKAFNVDGYCPVSRNDQWGLINKKGQEIIAPRYGSLKLIGDKCIVNTNGKFGIVSLTNEILMPFDYDRIEINSNNILRAKKDGQYAFYDINTFKRLSPTYPNVSKIEEGYYHTKSLDGKYTIYNSKVEKLTELDVDKLEYVSNNLWKYRINKKWGLIDVNGNRITDPDYDLMNRFQEGLILFSVEDKWGYLEPDGEIFLPAELPLAWEFKDGFARCLHRRGCGFINKNKELVIDRRIFEVRDFYNGLARYQTM